MVYLIVIVSYCDKEWLCATNFEIYMIFMVTLIQSGFVLY